MKNVNITPWVWNGFTNSGRNDNLLIYHWEKKGVEYIDYPFAKFNMQMTGLNYNDVEYNDCFFHDDWSREDTDYLFQLCKQYDLRWNVIEDRYNRPIKRSVEELKARYFKVCNRVLTYRRAHNKLLTKHEQDLVDFEYNINLDYQRNAQLEKNFTTNKNNEENVSVYQKELQEVDTVLRKIKSKNHYRNTDLDEFITDDNIKKALDDSLEFYFNPIPKQGVFRRGYSMYDKPDESHIHPEIFKVIDQILLEFGLDPHLSMCTEKTLPLFNHIKLTLCKLLILQVYLVFILIETFRIKRNCIKSITTTITISNSTINT